MAPGRVSMSLGGTEWLPFLSLWLLSEPQRLSNCIPLFRALQVLCGPKANLFGSKVSLYGSSADIIVQY